MVYTKFYCKDLVVSGGPIGFTCGPLVWNHFANNLFQVNSLWVPCVPVSQVENDKDGSQQTPDTTQHACADEDLHGDSAQVGRLNGYLGKGKDNRVRQCFLRCSIREITDHATFREKVQRVGWLDKLWVFSLWAYVIMPTLTTCSFQSMFFSKNVNINKEYMEYSLSHDVTQLGA